jgi:hypothetical protein
LHTDAAWASRVDLRQYIGFDLQAVRNPVGGVEKVDHGHDLYHGRVVQS